MAITVVSAGAACISNGGNQLITFGTPPIQDDLVIVFGGHGITHSSTVGVTTGGYTTLINDAAAAPALFLGYKFMGASPDTTVTGIGEGNVNDVTGYSYMIFRGVDLTMPFDVSHTTASGNSTNPNPPGITSITNEAMIIACALSMSNDSAFNIPSGYDDGRIFGLNETTDDLSIGIAWKAQATAGAEDPGTFNPWNSALWKTVTLALRPAAAGHTVAVNQITETDTANSITWSPKNRLVNQIIETDLAQAITHIKLKLLGQTSETDLAQSINRSKTRGISQISETDTADILTVL